MQSVILSVILTRNLRINTYRHILIVKGVNFPSGPQIGKSGFSGGFLVKTWKDICYSIGKLAGKVEDCSISWD